MKKILITVVAIAACCAAAPAGSDSPTPPASGPAVTQPLLHGIAWPGRRVTMAAPLDGVLMTVGVTEGQHVSSGQVMARMDDRVARAAVDAARASAERNAMIEHALKDIDLYESLLRRLTNTNSAGATTDYEVDEARARRDQAIATHKSALEQKHQAERNLALEMAKLEQHAIRAPFDGRIVRVAGETGQTLTKSDQLLTLVSLTTLHAEINLPVTLYHVLGVGKTYRLHAGAPIDSTIEGTLVSAEPMIDPATRTFRCVFEIDNADEIFPAGFTVELDMTQLEPALAGVSQTRD